MVFGKKKISNRKYFCSNLQTSKKMVYLEDCKFEKKYFRLKKKNWRIPSPRIPRQVCRVQNWRSWYFFKRDIQPRGKSTAKNTWQYHKLQSSANCFAQRGFMGIFNMSFLIPCRTKWHQKSFDINFFRVQPFSYQPIVAGSSTEVKWLTSIYKITWNAESIYTFQLKILWWNSSNIRQ